METSRLSAQQVLDLAVNSFTEQAASQAAAALAAPPAATPAATAPASSTTAPAPPTTAAGVGFELIQSMISTTEAAESDERR